jgi:hypothetical protein
VATLRIAHTFHLTKTRVFTNEPDPAGRITERASQPGEIASVIVAAWMRFEDLSRSLE